ncbi:MAG TPA: glycosyltransferase, partial [Burkholderiales bacterium]|nr:glycosyltransferase [Burkholderiales bacterium]
MLDQVTVVVVTYHSAHCLEALDALLAHCPHVVISDNGSGDGTPEQARARWPHATVLAHGRNLGFGAANNRALAATRTPLALLVNPDCEVTPDGLRELVRVANHMPEAAIIAPQLEGASGRADVNYRWPSTVLASRGPGAEGPACVGFVVGAAMLFRLSRF